MEQSGRIAASSSTKDIIKRHGFTVKKSLGQNFLIDAHVLNKIVAAAEIAENDLIIEIGPGVGGLTQALAETAKRVIAIEIDARLVAILKETLSGYDNVEILHADVLKMDFEGLLEKQPFSKVKVVANLPYYITTPIIMGLLEGRRRIDALVVMVQKEVAARMTAKPGSKDYGSLTLAVKYYSEAHLVANVPQNCFLPRPSVDSAVIRLKVREQPLFVAENEALLFKLIKCAFSMRRKTLLNCLSSQFASEGQDITKEDIKIILQNCGFGEQVRGETLDLEDFVRLTKACSHLGNR